MSTIIDYYLLHNKRRKIESIDREIFELHQKLRELERTKRYLVNDYYLGSFPSYRTILKIKQNKGLT